MDTNEEKFVILEQYKIYSEAKEKFIDRHFSTNKFYLVFNLIILVTTYLISTLTPQYTPAIVLGIIGFFASMMWWMNIDSYQMLIKIKYSKVLEYLETKLPEQPYHKEYEDYIQTKKTKNLIVFGDFQKYLTFAIMCVYIYIVGYAVYNIISIYRL